MFKVISYYNHLFIFMKILSLVSLKTLAKLPRS